MDVTGPGFYWVVLARRTIALSYILAINLILYAFIVPAATSSRRSSAASCSVSLTCQSGRLQSQSKYKQFALSYDAYLRQHFALIVEVIKADRQSSLTPFAHRNAHHLGLNVVYAVAMLTLPELVKLSTLQQTTAHGPLHQQFVFIILRDVADDGAP
ncbi:hypothetical protein TYRP_011666, partial [Tyrophagus putrescentiae]